MHDKDCCPALDAIAAEIPHLRRYARFLTRHADRADDLVQDGLEQAVKHIDQFTEGTNLRQWLFAILRHAHIDRYREAQRRPAHHLIDDWADKLASPPMQHTHLHLRRVLQEIDAMQERDREVIRLAIFESMPYKEIAGRLGVAEGTVKSRLWRARQTLASI
jgi:RNA polymerase sigma-70 factor (ECF subfamily)